MALMLTPRMMLFLEDQLIEGTHFYDVQMYTSIDRVLPTITFKIKDLNGDVLAGFGVYLGAHVKLSIVDAAADVSVPIGYCTFVITEIYDGMEKHDENLGGFIQVWAEQAWTMYGDYTGHAYAPQKISQTILDICKNANTYAALNIDEDRIKESSDEGLLPRYKSNMSDLEFIRQKLLPYLNVDGSNGFFFVDEHSRPTIQSFNSMFSSDPTLVITPPRNLLSYTQDEIKEYCEEKGIENTIAYQDMSIQYGDRGMDKAFSQIKQKAYIENNITGKVYVGVQTASVSCGSNSGKNYSAKLPFNTLRMTTVDATSSQIFTNMNFDDSVMSVMNDDIYLNDLFKLTVVTQGFAQVEVGQTVYFFAPNQKKTAEGMTTKEASRAKHWITGKWLVKSVLIKCLQDPNKIISQLELIKPTLTYNKDNTTIKHPSYFYSIG